ncbi:hypothetical protein ACFQ0T_33825 [Kitasatospora gansuensis]
MVVSKTADASSAEPGQRVTYTLKVTNPNGSTYPGATVTDDLTNVLDDATWGNDATTTSGTVTYAAPVLSWTGDVPAGRTVTITYSVTADNPDIGDHRLDNTIVGPAGSNCAAAPATPTAPPTERSPRARARAPARVPARVRVPARIRPRCPTPAANPSSGMRVWPPPSPSLPESSSPPSCAAGAAAEPIRTPVTTRQPPAR